MYVYMPEIFNRTKTCTILSLPKLNAENEIFNPLCEVCNFAQFYGEEGFG